MVSDKCSDIESTFHFERIKLKYSNYSAAKLYLSRPHRNKCFVLKGPLWVCNSLK